MITVYGLTDEHGQIRYVGQTGNPSERFRVHEKTWHDFKVEGLAVLSVEDTDEKANAKERKWITYFGLDNLHNKINGPRTATCAPDKIVFKVSSVLRGKLVEEAGDYGNISNVVRVILEKYFAKVKR
jgi:hypothetical protein